MILRHKILFTKQTGRPTILRQNYLAAAMPKHARLHWQHLAGCWRVWHLMASRVLWHVALLHWLKFLPQSLSQCETLLCMNLLVGFELTNDVFRYLKVSTIVFRSLNTAFEQYDHNSWTRASVWMPLPTAIAQIFDLGVTMTLTPQPSEPNQFIWP